MPKRGSRTRWYAVACLTFTPAAGLYSGGRMAWFLHNESFIPEWSRSNAASRAYTGSASHEAATFGLCNQSSASHQTLTNPVASPRINLPTDKANQLTPPLPRLIEQPAKFIAGPAVIQALDDKGIKHRIREVQPRSSISRRNRSHSSSTRFSHSSWSVSRCSNESFRMTLPHLRQTCQSLRCSFPQVWQQ